MARGADDGRFGDARQPWRGRRPGGRLRTALVVGQTALSLVLLFVAGMFVQSLAALARTDWGFAAGSLLSVRIDPRGAGLQETEQPQLGRR